MEYYGTRVEVLSGAKVRTMSHARSCNLNNLVSLAEEVAREVQTEELERDLDDLLACTDRDPLYIYKSKKRYPRTVVWELTLSCNMRCSHCGSSAGKGRRDELGRDEMFRLCDELGELECERLTLLGGEPLIHPHWEQIALRLQERRVRVNVITNGWTLNDPHLCDRIRNAGLSIVGISIDGLEKSHDALRRSGSFKRLSRGMDLLSEREITVAAVTVVTQDSIKEINELYNFFVDRGVKVWQLQIAAPLGRLHPDNPILIQPHQVQMIYDFLKEKKASKSTLTIDLADNIGYFPPGNDTYFRTTRRNNKSWIGCLAGIQVLGIDSNGDIKGCQSLPSIPKFIEGNVRETPLKEIWNNPDGFSYNRRFSRSQLGGFCSDCRYASLCKAGCSSTAYAYSGSTGDNPMCIYRDSQEQGPAQNLGLGELKKQGRELIENKEYRRALRLFEHVIAQNPQDRHILDILGFLCYMTGSYKDAADYCTRSLEIKPDNPYSLKGLGLCLVEMDQVDKGIALIRKAIEIDPEFFDAHFDLAVVYMKTKQFGRARQHFEKAKTIDPNRNREVNRALTRLERLSNPSS